MATTIDGIDGLKAYVGQHLGYSDYVEITQEQVNLFADATGDHQWIHVDVERAKAGPVRRPDRPRLPDPVAGPRAAPRRSCRSTGVAMGVNYGANKVRFPSPVPVGAKLRLGATLLGVEDVDRRRPGARSRCTFEVEGAPKPACVAEIIFRYYV